MKINTTFGPMPWQHFFFILFIPFLLVGQVNIVPNSGFESTLCCPANGAAWPCSASWNNVNMKQGIGLWGTPDFFHACGANDTAPPATFSGTCTTHTGSGMMGLVLYNQGYTDYREYIATPLAATMQPGFTYTVSFWITNGTGIKSPWTISNIGIHFSNGPLVQKEYAVINTVPQCEVTSQVSSTVWTQYTFTVAPATPWNYMTFGGFRPDASSNVTQSFLNPGGPASAYANYFVDDISVLAAEITGLSALSGQDDQPVFLFPQPATGSILINLNSIQKDLNSIAIYNLQGERVKFIDRNAVRRADSVSMLEIDLAGLSRGMYLLQIDFDGGALSKKFIKGE